MAEEGKEIVASLHIFEKMFNELNIGFHKLKKDKCSFCEQIRNEESGTVCLTLTD
jgi:hypothetical protein